MASPESVCLLQKCPGIYAHILPYREWIVSQKRWGKLLSEKWKYQQHLKHLGKVNVRQTNAAAGSNSNLIRFLRTWATGHWEQ